MTSRIPPVSTSRTASGSPTLTMWAVWAICFVTVVSVVSWRRDAIFSGAIDSVVIAKAVLATAALAAAVVLYSRTRPRYPVGAQSAYFLAAILGVSGLGAIAEGSPLASFVVITRVAILAAIVIALLAVGGWRPVLGGLLGSLGTVAVVAAVTGIPKLGAEGRLVGGIPEVAANELAGLAAPPLIALLVLIMRDGVRVRTVIPAFALAAVVWATESRTGLIAIGIALLVAFLAVRRIHWSTMVAVALSLPVIYTLAVYTTVITDLLVRGQSIDDIATLSARTDAWRVVFAWSLDSWARWLGVGLAVKEVPVSVDNREFQVLDSSWVSVLAQAGIVGVVLLLAILVPAVLRAVTVRELSVFALPLLALILVRSVTESGLIDSSVTFLLFFTLAVALEPGSQGAPAAPPPPPDFRGRRFGQIIEDPLASARTPEYNRP
jgi:hypothetical protein